MAGKLIRPSPKTVARYCREMLDANKLKQLRELKHKPSISSSAAQGELPTSPRVGYPRKLRSRIYDPKTL